MKSRKEIYNFMSGYTLGVLSYCADDGTPQGALVGFGQTKDLSILIRTNIASRKYTAIKNNPHVSFTIGGTSADTVQIQGVARELTPDEYGVLEANFLGKVPHAQAFHGQPDERYFTITPSWLRYTDVRTSPWDITEVQF